ncbi:MAG: N,N-dimethylformamidase [Alphaproteobacteria bacterium]|nr:N,N-dimethylformamidase [Alphaproteobacteria bacterium]
MKITAYADRLSAAPGDTVHFFVSCDGVARYRADIVRLICGDLNPKGPGYKERVIKTPVNRPYKGRKQTTATGSYGIVPHHAALEALPSLAVQALIWPTTPDKGEQVLLAQWQGRRGFELIIDERGALALRIGEGARAKLVSTGKRLLARRWYRIGAALDGNTGQLKVYQEPLEALPRLDDGGRAEAKIKRGAIALPAAPLTMAAGITTTRGRERTTRHYNGKLEAPVIADRVFTPAALQAAATRTRAGRIAPGIVAAWDFSRDMKSTRIIDCGRHGLDGTLVNLPARAMTGHSWPGGQGASPANHPEHYGAIHFHDDDLYDAGWDCDFALIIPIGLKSGIYAARLRAGEHEDYVPFYVRPRRGTATAKIAFLAPTASYAAYANQRMTTDAQWAELMMGRLTAWTPQDIFLNEHRDYGSSLYDTHTDGSGICYSSMRRPVLNFRPKVTLYNGAMGSSLWAFNADLHLTDWLEAKGFRYDVITDDDLHHEGLGLLKPYRAILTGTHPEYYSIPMWQAVKAYTDQGGRLMYLGGNGFYWRIAYHESLPGVIEVRRPGPAIRAWDAKPGEHWQSFDGREGGLFRQYGMAPQTIAGVGFVSQGFDLSSYYRRTKASRSPRARFIFEGVKDDLIGNFGCQGGGAAGIEIDCADVALGTPPHALVLATSENHTENYLLVLEELVVTLPTLSGRDNPRNHADLVFYETPNGGAVFSVGSIAWCGSLSHNRYHNNVSRITQNVLAAFASDRSF